MTELLKDLATIVALMKAILSSQSPFNDIASLHTLYKKYQDTNSIIDYAEGVLDSGEGINQLLEDAKTLCNRATICYQLYGDNCSIYDAIDTQALLDAHIKPFREAIDAEKAIANNLWQEYQQLSNQLDYTNIETPDYKDLDVKCEALKSEYATHHDKVNELHKAWKNEIDTYADVAMFSIENLSLVLFYMQRISKSIIDTIGED